MNRTQLLERILEDSTDDESSYSSSSDDESIDGSYLNKICGKGSRAKIGEILGDDKKKKKKSSPIDVLGLMRTLQDAHTIHTMRNAHETYTDNSVKLDDIVLIFDE